MIAKAVYLFLAVLSMMSSQGLLEKLSIVGVIWAGLDLIFTVLRFIRLSKQISSSLLKHLLHTWLVELMGEFSQPIFLISANANGPEWTIPLISWYKPFKWLFVYTSYCDPFSGMPQKRELSTSIIIDENPVQGCLRELKPLQMRLRSCIVILDEESPGWCFIVKTTGASKKWKFDRVTAEVLYQVFVLMNEDSFIVEGPGTGRVLHCMELDKLIKRTIMETRSGLIAHRRVVVNDEMRAFRGL